eukprot:351697-Chlamydomonas_euryale.AAC.15
MDSNAAAQGTAVDALVAFLRVCGEEHAARCGRWCCLDSQLPAPTGKNTYFSSSSDCVPEAAVARRTLPCAFGSAAWTVHPAPSLPTLSMAF